MNSRGPPGRGRGGGRGYGRGRGYYSGGGRYNNHRGRGDYGGRGGRYIPRGGGGRTPRMGSYSSIGRGGGDGRDHGNHLDRNRDNDSNANSRGVGSYADLASSIPSYSDIGRSIGGGNGERGGGPMQNNNNNRDDVGMSSYAQLGEMSQPPPPSLGMKRGRPLEDRPPQMMGSNNYGADDMGPRGGGGGGPPPSYRGHNNRDDGMARGPQPPHNDYRQPPDNMQDKRSSLPHQPPPPDDKFGGRRGPDWGGRSDSHEDQFGRQLPPKRTSSGYGRGPPVRGHPRFVPDANRADSIMQRPESLSPPPRRENSYHRFDGQRSSHDASMPSYASIADKPIPQPVEERPTQQHDNTKRDDAVVEVKRDEAKVAESKRRSSTPPPPVETPVVVVPPSPKSPSPAPPSAYALAVSRMVEMNADMEFAWVRMQMIDTEVKIIEARLESME